MYTLTPDAVTLWTDDLTGYVAIYHMQWTGSHKRTTFTRPTDASLARLGRLVESEGWVCTYSDPESAHYTRPSKKDA